VVNLARLRALRVPLWARAAVTLGLIGLVFSRIHVDAAAHRLASGHWSWFALAAFVLLVALAVGAVRWHLFLRAAGVARSLPDTVRAYAIGAFATSFLPSAFGGDAVRAWVVSGRGTRTRALATVVIDRASMLGAAVVFAWGVLALDPEAIPWSLVVALLTVSVLLLGAAGAVALLVFVAGRRKLHSLVTEVASTARACLGDRRVLWRTFLLGITYEALAVLSLWLVAKSISLGVSFVVLAVTVPPVLVLTALPFSIGGLGVREGSYVLFLHQAGVSTTGATMLSLLSTVLYALATLPGACALLARRWSSPPTRASDSTTSGATAP
jgi:glycosyltransferase 2 family protein